MVRQILKSKITGARVTTSGVDLDAHTVGPTLLFDRDVLRRADLWPGERVEVLNRDNGAHFAAVVGEAPGGSRSVVVLGASAHLAREGHKLDVHSFIMLSEGDLSTYKLRVLVLSNP